MVWIEVQCNIPAINIAYRTALMDNMGNIPGTPMSYGCMAGTVLGDIKDDDCFPAENNFVGQ